MKKSLSLLIAIVMVFSMFASVAFAAEDATTTSSEEVTSTDNTATEPEAPASDLTTEQKFEALKKLGIFEGDQNGEAGLDQDMTRAQFAKIVALVKGLTIDESATSDFKDVISTNHWASKYIAAVSAATPVLMNGVGQGNFDPDGKVSLQMLATVLVRALGIPTDPTVEVEGAHDWAWQYVDAAVKAGLIPATDDYTANALRAQLVESTYEAVEVIELDTAAKTATYKIIDSKTVEVTVGEEVITVNLETALEANKTTTITVPYKGKSFELDVTYTITSVDLASAAALSSKTVEVVLNTAVTSVDASVFSLKDAEGNAVEIKNAVIAPYVTDGKTVLVSLAANTTVGTLYTLTSGSKSVNFGGRANDGTGPVVSDISSSDYNEVTIKFNESVNIEALSVAFSEKYDSAKKLEIKGIKYSGADAVVVSTSAQTGELYGAVISGAADFDGNVMTSDDSQTFVGQVMPTDKLQVQAAGATDYKTVTAEFNVKVDPASIAASSFAIKETYGTASIEVESARLATTSDYDSNNVQFSNETDASKAVVLTLKTGLSESTLYTLSISGNLKTLYGYAIDTDNDDTTFTGVAAPTSLTYTTTGEPAASGSNTTVVVKFSNKLDKETAENVANYAIKETYGTATLAVSAAALQSNGKDVKLTVASQSNALYTLTTTNVKDVYGNTMSTTDSANQTTFVGKEIAAAIASVSATALVDPYTSLTLTFDQNVGASASDVSHYFIDNGIGYPTKAVAANGNQVVLTIPTTSAGTLYTVTVKGLENSDGVAMAAAGVSTTFVGNGSTVAKPSIKGAVAIDSQTLRVFFDVDVTNSKVGGNVVWDSSANTVESDLTYTGATAGNFAGAYAWQDPANTKALLIRLSGTPFTAANASNNKFTLTFANGGSELATATATFAKNDATATPVAISSAKALNEKTVRVYFNQPVDEASVGTVTFKKDSTPITFTNYVAADSTKTVFDFYLGSTVNDGASKYYVEAAATGALSVTDVSGKVFVTTAQSKQFAYSAVALTNITSGLTISSPNARQIVVYFPEAMDSTTVQDISNYDILDASSNGLTPDIADIVYDSSTNKATITLATALTSSSKYFISISDVWNSLGSKRVSSSSTGTDPYKAQFALSTTAAPTVTVASATYNSASSSVTIKFNQLVENSIAAGDFTLTVNDGAAGAFTLGTITYKTAANGTVYVESVTLNITTPLTANKVGKVSIASATALKGINGQDSTSGSSATFAQINN